MIRIGIGWKNTPGLVNSGQVRLLQEVGNEAQARQVRLACADIAIRNGPQTSFLQAWQDFASSFNALDALLRITPEIPGQR